MAAVENEMINERKLSSGGMVSLCVALAITAVVLALGGIGASLALSGPEAIELTKLASAGY